MSFMTINSTFQSFMRSPFYSIKHTNYFEVYDSTLSRFVGSNATFVEIGILDGGSLFMWRDFLGKDARIIGVDLNPKATKWRDFGFEIFIGDQSTSEFWNDFFRSVGSVDVILDDGGHRNDQQIITVLNAIQHVRDGGLIIIEDTQTSFMKFESFQKYTFISFLKSKINDLYGRSNELNFPYSNFTSAVHSIEFFTGLCVLNVDRKRCMTTSRIENGGKSTGSDDFRYLNDGRLQTYLRGLYNWVSIDYMSPSRKNQNHRYAKAMQAKTLRNLLRFFIVPLRFVLYTALKLCNFLKLKRSVNRLNVG